MSTCTACSHLDFGNTSIQFKHSGSHSTNALCASRLQIRSFASGQFQYIEMTEKDKPLPPHVIQFTDVWLHVRNFCCCPTEYTDSKAVAQRMTPF